MLGTLVQPLRMPGGATIYVYVPETPEDKRKGLLQLQFLGPNQGMLINFDTYGYHSITTMGMRFPIDIVWLVPDGHITALVRNIMNKVVGSSGLVSGVLELPAGTINKLNLKVGDQIG